MAYRFLTFVFDAWKLGPVSKDLFVELSDEPNLLSEYISKERVENDRFVICAKREFSNDEFSDNEMELLEQVAERFKYCTAKELINFTHRKNSPLKKMGWSMRSKTGKLLQQILR